MNNKKSYYILGGILVVLIIIAYLVTSERGPKTSTEKIKEEQFFKVDSALVDKVEFERNGVKIALAKVGPVWREIYPNDYMANQNFISQMLSHLKNYKLSNIVSENPEMKDRYGFNDTNVTKITVYQTGNVVGSFLIGNAASGPSQTFIKKLNDDKIYLADNFLRNYFVKERMFDWRDLQIVALPKESIKSIRFIHNDEDFTVTFDTTAQAFIDRDTVDKAQAEGLLNLLNNYNTQSFRDTTLGNDMKPDYKVIVTADKVWEFEFFKVGTEERNPKYLLRVSGLKQIFEVDENFVKMLYKSKKELLPKKEK
ncbi:MAG: DUF4340 domain-containing protein [Ignavibacteria bacterium]